MAMKYRELFIYLFIFFFFLQNDRNICLKRIDRNLYDVISRILQIICKIIYVYDICNDFRILFERLY